MKPVELPGALCIADPEAFEVAGKTASQIRRAAYTCTQCPALTPCARDAAGTLDMVRAGRVYSPSGVPYQTEVYIRRRLRARTAALIPRMREGVR